MSLADKQRRARETVVEVDGYRFTVRRPTDKEALSMSNVTFIEIAERFVVDWSGVREVDIIPGGSPTEIPFDREVWREWCSDSPHFWEPLSTGVMDSYASYRKSQEDAKKKP